MLRKPKKREKLEFEPAEDVVGGIAEIVRQLPEMSYVKLEKVYCVRSHGSTARAYARTWGMPRIFHITAGYEPAYVIEVIAKYFDPLPQAEKVKVLIHELMHIPKTFSGALKPHSSRHHRIDQRTVEKLYKKIVS